MSAFHEVLGFNVFGYVSGNLGLSVAARNTLRMLRARDEPFCVVDIQAGWGRSGHDTSFLEAVCAELPPPFLINLIHTNPADMLTYLVDQPGAVEWRDKVNACVPFWELPRLPNQTWVRFLEDMDIVLAPTRYIESAVRSSTQHSWVVHYPQAVFLPPGVRRDRARWGIPSEAFACWVVADAASDVERKNPVAAIEAFRHAFPSEAAGAYLVVRLVNANMSRQTATSARRIRDALRGVTHATVLDGPLNHRSVLCLGASCDTLISLHRAEGLGLNLMEAMSLGKPVIATGWSGNLDFMTNENSWLVGYDLVPVESSHPDYAPDAIGEGQTWAEPSVEEAAEALRTLEADPSLRAAMGARAAADMETARAEFLAGRAFEVFRELPQSERMRGASRQDRIEDLRQLVTTSASRRFKRRAGNLLRKWGLRG